jgi:hypothetical protein
MPSDRRRRPAKEADPLDREIDFRGGERGKYADRVRGATVALVAPIPRDVWAYFKTVAAMTSALRGVMRAARARRKPRG